MAEKGFGVKEVNLIGASGTPTITSPNNLNLNANNVAISTNVSIGGTLSVTGNVSVGGTLTYEDVTNIDSVGLITARTGVFLPDDQELKLGNTAASPDTKIYTDSSNNNTLIESANPGVITLKADYFRVKSTNGGDMIQGNTSTFVSLYHGGAQRLSTSNAGITVTGAVTATTFSGSGASLTNLPAANLTGTLPAISGANLTGIAVTEAPVVDYTITANGSSAYRFHGGGVDETADNATLYLIRGQKYRFNNTTGSSHPFALRVSNGGSAYTDGVTGSQNGIQFFTVPYAAPSSLVYQCTVHSGMVGSIVIRGGSSTAAISNNADNRVITGGTDGNLNGESGLTFSSDRLILTNTSTPQIRINNDTSDGSSTRFVLGKATGSNNFFNGAVAGDSCIGFPGDLLFGVGTSIKMRIDSDGHVTKPNNLCLQYTVTGSQNYSSSGTVIYNSEVFDVGDSNAYNTSNGEFTAPVTGIYRIQYEYFAAGAGRGTAGIEKYNGSSWSTVKNGMRIYSVSGGSNWHSGPTIFYLQLNATQKFRIIWQEGTVHLNTPWNHLTVQLVQ